MPNQDELPKNDLYFGSSSTPIEAAWLHFCSHHKIDGTLPEYESMKFVFYCAAMSAYNTITASMHMDHTLTLTVIVTEKMRTELETYFENTGQPKMH